jgi:hypothetical protein
MLELITCAAISVAFFMLILWAYRRGLKDGLALKDNKPIEPIKTPVQVIQEHKEVQETKQENDKVAQGLLNLLNFDGTPQKEE